MVREFVLARFSVCWVEINTLLDCISNNCPRFNFGRQRTLKNGFIIKCCSFFFSIFKRWIMPFLIRLAMFDVDWPNKSMEEKTQILQLLVNSEQTGVTIGKHVPSYRSLRFLGHIAHSACIAWALARSSSLSFGDLHFWCCFVNSSGFSSFAIERVTMVRYDCCGVLMKARFHRKVLVLLLSAFLQIEQVSKNCLMFIERQ